MRSKALIVDGERAEDLMETKAALHAWECAHAFGQLPAWDNSIRAFGGVHSHGRIGTERLGVQRMLEAVLLLYLAKHEPSVGPARFLRREEERPCARLAALPGIARRGDRRSARRLRHLLSSVGNET